MKKAAPQSKMMSRIKFASDDEAEKVAEPEVELEAPKERETVKFNGRADTDDKENAEDNNIIRRTSRRCKILNSRLDFVHSSFFISV